MIVDRRLFQGTGQGAREPKHWRFGWILDVAWHLWLLEASVSSAISHWTVLDPRLLSSLFPISFRP